MMMNQQYYDGYWARKSNKEFRPKADESWRIGWTDAELEETYDGNLQDEMMGHYEYAY